MATPNMQTAGLQDSFLPVVIQSFLADICSKVLLTLVQGACTVKGSCGASTITCMTSCLQHGELRHTDSIRSCTTTGCNSSDSDEENASENCTVSICDHIPVPEVDGRVSRHHFSEWLLVAKNKDDEDEDEDDEDDDDDEEGDDNDDEGDDEEGDDDEEGGEAEGEEGEGDDDDEDDEADEDDDEEEEGEEDDDDEDESPPKKLRK